MAVYTAPHATLVENSPRAWPRLAALFLAALVLAAPLADAAPETGAGAGSQADAGSMVEGAPDGFDAFLADFETLEADADPSQAARRSGEAARRWLDVSLEAVSERAERAEALLTRLARLEPKSGVDAAIAAELLRGRIRAAEHDLARIPFTGDYGFHAEPVFTALRLAPADQSEAEAWIDRLRDVPRYFAQNVENMRRGMETGWTAHADPLATTIAQVREQAERPVRESELYLPFTRLPANLPLDVRARLRAEGREAVAEAIAAYGELLVFLEGAYAQAVRPSPGLASLPGGRDAYVALLEEHTSGADYGPATLHDLGLAEVARIRAEMDAIIAETGFQGGFEAFVRYLRTDPRFYAETPDELMAAANALADRLDAILPRYFNHLPRLSYAVAPVPGSIAPGYTTGRYVQGDPERGEVGTYLVNTYRLDQRPLYELPALTAHEAVPGHHLQIALAQELRHVPDFRRRYYATAFGEGWGLYAERLAGEAGIYQTPYERFGALSFEMWRACRLVADTGLHWYGWSRERAARCFRENTALSEHNIETEVTRYIGWPGQATAYKVGELKILELRRAARERLGPAFDIKAFHDHLLRDGALPLSLLEPRMKRWIDGQVQAVGAPDQAGVSP